MNKNYAFDRCLCTMSLNLEVIEELEKALYELQNTMSRGHVTCHDSSDTLDLDYCAAVS